MRATRRRLRRSSLGASSRSVCCLMRRRNKFSFASLSVSPSCSSLMSRSSIALAMLFALGLIAYATSPQKYFLTLSSYHSYADRHFVGEACKAQFCGCLGHSPQFVQNRTRSHDRGPKLRFPFTLTPPGFERGRRDRFVREYGNVQPAFATDVLRCRNTSGFNRLGTHPAALYRLQSELTKDDALATRGVTFYTSSLAFSVLHPLGHQRHQSRPRTCLD